MSNGKRKTVILGAAIVAVAIGSVPARAALGFTAPVVCSGDDNRPVEVKSEPVAVVSNQEIAMVAWSDYRRGVGGDIFLSRSSSSGGFDDGARINEFPVASQPEWSWNHGMVSLALGPNREVYAAWMERRPSPDEECNLAPRCDTDIFLARSNDGGLTWDATNYAVSDDRIDSESQPAIAVSGSGRVHAVWVAIEQRRVRYSSSDDGGLSWTPSRSLGSPPQGAEQWEPAIAAQADKVHVVWTERTAEGGRIYGVVSPNEGGAFRPADRFDGGGLLERPRGNPSVAVRGDGVGVVAWEDYSNGASNPDIFFTYIVPAQAFIGDAIRIDDDPVASPQLRPRAAFDGQGRPAVVWQDYRNGLDDPDIYATRSTGIVLPFTFETNVRVNVDTATSAETRPAIALSPADGRLLVVWEHSKRTGGVDILASSTLD